ncbi:DUF2203 domain-containing protein [Roseisolibacter sp. H3M3-2]|uniref:DUF2203 domain-containing protein n=1 Tax=Roseisolibacter sp. H3M3-2 TaxID=3031323 RepID=UPI0023DBEC2E|nr:DUF2203 domain-containing protein [Roseisolibacter sp. H3M3-2]MDF1504163.1 DUF2203 domain-containing protein [Roseisolibacter sp. H3M3-2]
MPDRPEPDRPDVPDVPVAERLYTVDAANATLPFVRRVAEDLVRDYARWRARVRAIEVARRAPSSALPAPTARRLQRETQALAADIQTSLGELALLGVQCKSLEDGLIDFPTVVDGAPAFLCWRPGEADVSWWHRRDAGFGGRQPIAGALVSAAAVGGDA